MVVVEDFLENMNGYEMGFSAIRNEADGGSSKHNRLSNKEKVEIGQSNPTEETLPVETNEEPKKEVTIEEEEEVLGVRVDDVELPPWANGSSREFIRLHR